MWHRRGKKLKDSLSSSGCSLIVFNTCVARSDTPIKETVSMAQNRIIGMKRTSESPSDDPLSGWLSSANGAGRHALDVQKD